MVQEVIAYLNLKPGCTIVDGTVGEGGHAVIIARKIKRGFLIGIDKDRANLETAKKRITDAGVRVKLFHGSYADIKKFLKEAKMKYADGVLLDLGFSMRQIKEGGRGFSFSKDETLDMRYDRDSGIPAYMWLNRAQPGEIEDALRNYGQEPEYRRVARAIVRSRQERRIMTSVRLSSIVSEAKLKKHGKIHPATKTFQAVRIFINNELGELGKGLKNSLDVIKQGGRLAVLTYHSLEDRIVKDFFRLHSGACVCPDDFPVCRCSAEYIKPRVRVLKALRPADKEIKANPPARSAHLRACEVLEAG
jgi:16S rRNA (cytosine1402-N4)-methyltransferase